jgi:hypothetical protein
VALSLEAAARDRLTQKSLAIFWVPNWNPIVLASFMIGPHYINAINNENDINHEVIYWIENDQGV